MPKWMGQYAVSEQEGKDGSVLEMYKSALKLRKEYQCEEEMEWVEAAPNVLRFKRPNGWECVANFGEEEADMPEGKVLMSSGPVGSKLSGETTVWLKSK
jgi:alpha-glucosidase